MIFKEKKVSVCYTESNNRSYSKRSDHLLEENEQLLE